jgi:hypothetical protein
MVLMAGFSPGVEDSGGPLMDLHGDGTVRCFKVPLSCTQAMPKPFPSLPLRPELLLGVKEAGYAGMTAVQEEGLKEMETFVQTEPA